MAVHTDTHKDEKSMWSPDYEAEFWMLLGDWASKFEFLKRLPSTFLSQVMRDTWQRPCRPGAAATP